MNIVGNWDLRRLVSLHRLGRCPKSHAALSFPLGSKRVFPQRKNRGVFHFHFHKCLQAFSFIRRNTNECSCPFTSSSSSTTTSYEFHYLLLIQRKSSEWFLNQYSIVRNECVNELATDSGGCSPRRTLLWSHDS